MTSLALIRRRSKTLRLAREHRDTAIREAVAAKVPKTDVAEAAGISRPTLYAILSQGGDG